MATLVVIAPYCYVLWVLLGQMWQLELISLINLRNAQTWAFVTEQPVCARVSLGLGEALASVRSVPTIAMMSVSANQ